MRYLHQPLSDIDEWPVDELVDWYEELGALLEREVMPTGG